MLQDFLVANRSEIIERVRRRAHGRGASESRVGELQDGAPILLTQIADALAGANASPALGEHGCAKEIGERAAQHGNQLLKHGSSIAEVVNSYGDVCQVVTQLAVEADAAISAGEFHVFNNCLDEAIKGAVSAYACQRERDLAYQSSERLGILAHEMRNLLNTMTLSFAIVRQGKVGLGGARARCWLEACPDSRHSWTVRSPRFGRARARPSSRRSRWSSS